MTDYVERLSRPTKAYKSYEDSGFVTGDSPATHDVITDLGRPAIQGYISNDGAGDLTFALKLEKAGSFGDEITLKTTDDPWRFEGMDIYQIRVTWVTDTSYRIYTQ